jgi:metallo-beta-lactamase family protein
MRVEFHGAARTVTGSATLLEAGNSRVLVDCGQFQGPDELEAKNRERFRFDAHALDALVLTHAHIDHVGRAPLLVPQGFRGRVVCTRATAAVAGLMWRDGLKIMEEDHRRYGGPPPAYGEKDLLALERAIQTARYGETVKVTPHIAVTLSDAGHILGSAHVLARLSEGGREVLFGVSGDIGAKNRPVVADPTPFERADYVQMEGTYGDRDHRAHEASLKELQEVLERTQKDRGVALVPAFALGRTQDLLYHLNTWKNAGRFEDLPVYVDSPLATRLTHVFQGNPQALDDDAKALLKRGDDPFDFPGLTFVTSPAESERVGREAAGALIIASSGMCQSGRIVAHLQHLLPRPSTKLVIVGYQAPGTLGSRLIERPERVTIRGRDVEVRAEIHTLGGFSAHAGRRELLDWIAAVGGPPKKVFLCHGEVRALESFGQGVRDELGLETVIPALGQSFAL